MALNKYEWLTRRITSLEHEAIRTDFLEYRFSRMRWFVTKVEKNECSKILLSHKVCGYR